MKRTNKQNRSLHLWFRQAADGLNGAGFSVNDREVFRVDVPFTEENLKFMAHIFLDHLKWEDETGETITSTSQLSTKQAIELYEIMSQQLAERANGFHQPWPSDESLSEGQR